MTAVCFREPDALRGRLLIGLSGGADSVALTLLLLPLREAGQATLAAIHVNHGLRGAESDGDAAFAADFCRAHDIPLTVVSLTPPPHSGEDWARQARYEAFARAYRAWSADALVLAHHREDQAETVLLHMLRGTGLRGLTGMRSRSERLGMTILRPLLDTPRQTLRNVLLEAGQTWREDSTNAGDAYLRNRVRHHLLPLMEDIAPGAAERIASAACLLVRDEDALSELARLTPDMAGDRWLRLTALDGQPEAVQARRLRAWLEPVLPDVPDAILTDRLLALAAGKTEAVNLPGGSVVRRGRRFLHITGDSVQMQASVPADGPMKAVVAGTEITIAPADDSPCDGRLCQDLPAELPSDCVLRTRRSGDYIRPFGMEGKQSLQDYLVNRRVEAPFRDWIPLLVRGSEVLWVCGVGAGHIARRQPGQSALRIAAVTMPVWTP